MKQTKKGKKKGNEKNELARNGIIKMEYEKTKNTNYATTYSRHLRKGTKNTTKKKKKKYEDVN